MLRKDEVSVSIKLSVKLQRMKNNQNYDRGGLKRMAARSFPFFLFTNFNNSKGNILTDKRNATHEEMLLALNFDFDYCTLKILKPLKKQVLLFVCNQNQHDLSAG